MGENSTFLRGMDEDEKKRAYTFLLLHLYLYHHHYHGRLVYLLELN